MVFEGSKFLTLWHSAFIEIFVRHSGPGSLLGWNILRLVSSSFCLSTCFSFSYFYILLVFTFYSFLEILLVSRQVLKDLAIDCFSN